ncbi:helix-turn-helix transcriptional regulator [Ochrobactrum teleogrylli]|uniref:Response regulator transcription factor n=2 Tax=Ochrobactrum TaxID=528 RepID=A0ABY2Y8E9_9HYPH|nr:response regulator transcription factor [[Ochrobactrum] teleogrylli]TNV18190.1 response regulator transcription factor [[Ochrobactrum] teleogrylli]
MNLLIIDSHDIYLRGTMHGLKNIDKKYCIYGCNSISDWSEDIENLILSAVLIAGDCSPSILTGSLEKIKEKLPLVPIILMVGDDGSFRCGGFDSYNIKSVIKRSTSIDGLHDVISVINSGFTCYSNEINSMGNRRRNSGLLSNRKEEILRLVLDGCTNKQIAKILNISPGTVKSHIESILVKLNVNSRIKAATTYFMNGHAADNLSVVSDRNFGVE